MSTKKVAELSPVALEVYDVLKASPTQMTLAQIKEVVPNAQPANLSALSTRGLVSSQDVEVVVSTKRTVLAYKIPTPVVVVATETETE